VAAEKSEHPAKRYVRRVISGEQLTCQLVRLAVERHQRDLERQTAPDYPFYFDESAAQRVIDFFQFCNHVEGKWAGTPVVLEDWQQFALWVPFGWKRKGTNLRRFRRAYIEVARKNGKSTWTAGLGLYFLRADGEAGGQVYSAATTRDQAKIIHGAAAKMVKVSPFLSRSVQVFRNNISVPETFSKFEPLSADFNTLDGLSPSAGLIDEIHAHKNRGVVDVIETGMGARQQPMMWMITTAGINTADSIALEFRNHGEQVLKGIREDEVYFPLIYTQDDDDDWLDESLWIKSNPSLGVSVNLDELRELALKAKEIPAAQNNFKTKRLNIWCNSRSRWIPVERWDACREDYAVQELLGKECYAGLDLSTTTDISALVLVFPWEDGRYRVLPFYWVPLENADLRARRDRVPYPLWIEKGHVFGTPGNAIDYGFIRKKIVDLSSLYKVREIAADPWNATQILQQLQEEDGLPVVEMRQGFASMSSPMKSLEALVMSQRLRHHGCPVLRWMMDNVSVRMDPAGNIKPDKEKSAERIDGVVALIMGVGRAELRKAPASNPYESGGVFAL
jgi:phage terminase large subunit-like protein